MEIQWKKIEQNQTPIWDFEENPLLEGALVDVKTEVGPNKSKLYVVKLLSNSENVSVWGSKVIDDRLATIEIGDFVKIEYTGKKKSKNGAMYKNYDIYVFHNGDKKQEINADEIPFD